LKNSLTAKFVTLLLVAFGVGACGRPATEDECREILRRTAELEMQGRLGSRELIEAEIKALEASMRPQMMKKCVGKRITDDAMACVRKAKSAEQLAQDCFR
jgi:hypothetical protein